MGDEIFILFKYLYINNYINYDLYIITKWEMVIVKIDRWLFTQCKKWEGLIIFLKE